MLVRVLIVVAVVVAAEVVLVVVMKQGDSIWKFLPGRRSGACPFSPA